MVFFICNACGETLKRNKVDTHYRTKCRNCEVLSCVDCSKEFWGDEYLKHMTCISEEEKYSGSNYVAKPNKGEVKQELWQKAVEDAVQKNKDNPKMKNLLTRLIEHSNIPRKQKKFENFMKSSFGVRDNKLISEVWVIINQTPTGENTIKQSDKNTPNNNTTETKLTLTETTNKQCENSGNTECEPIKKLSKRDKKEQRRHQNDKKEKKDKNKNVTDSDMNNSDIVKIKKKRKRKHEESDDEEAEYEVTNGQENEDNEEEIEEDEQPVKKQKIKFNWERVILEVLTNKGEEIPVKKLRKKVLAEYASQGGCLESEEELCAKFNKKLTKNPKFKVLKERVKLRK